MLRIVLPDGGRFEEYRVKLVFHIPYFYADGDKVCASKTHEFRKALISKWEEIGVNYFNSTMTTVPLAGTEVSEELLTVYCRKDFDDEPVLEVFLKLIFEYHKVLCQDNYYYESYGKLVSIHLGVS